MFTRWSSELITGNELIDRQHRRIFERAEEIISDMREGAIGEDAAVLLNYLEGYCFSHFAAEEALQIKYGDPNHVEHRELHEEFRRQVTTLKWEAVAPGATAEKATKVVLLTLEWLAEHIGKMDKELAAHIRRVSEGERTPVARPHQS